MNKNILIGIFILISMATIIVAQDDLLSSTALDKRVNEFTNSSENKIAMLIPALLLVVAIISWSIDFGTTGVTIGAMVSMVLLYWLKLIYINPISLISFSLMFVILVFKMKR